MKLVFRKSEDSQINVFLKIDEEETEFSYVDMIMNLIDSRNMEEADIFGEFTDAEKRSITSMISFINKELSTTAGSDTES